MDSIFSSDFFVGNRQRLRTLFTGTAPIVLTAHGLLQRNSDTTFPFRQDSSFWYFTGINDPDILLVMDKEKEYLIVPVREGLRETFDGSIDIEKLKQTSGITTIYSEEDGWRQLGARLKRVKHAAVLAAVPGYVASHGMYTNPARARLIRRMKKYNPTIDLLDLRQHVTLQRVIKQPQEIAAIERAIAITGAALRPIRKKLQQYEYEYEIEADISAAFRKSQAVHAYQPIVAGGGNACTLHYIANESALPERGFVLLDVGAEFSLYAADITRTYIRGELTKRQERMLAAVVETQEFAFSQLKPGVTIKECEKHVEQFMGEKLRELGLIKTITHESVREFYPHATSHYLGLDVHDVGDYERPLEAGMVITVEPGIYIPNEGVGIRIEDDVLITAEGIRNLSESLSRDPR